MFDCEREYLFDDLHCGDAVRPDLIRVACRAQRRNRTLTINLVPKPHVIQYLGKVGLVPSFDKLAKTTSRPLLQGGLQVDLERRIRQDHGANVPAHHHHASLLSSARAVLETDKPLLAAQFLPNKAVRGHDGNDAVDPWAAYRPGHIQSSDVNRRLAAIPRIRAWRPDAYGQLPGYASNSPDVAAIDSSVQYGPGDGPVHDAGIEEEKIQALPHQVADSALA